MIAIAMLTSACGILAGRFHHQLGVAPILGAILCATCFLRPRDLFIVGLGGILLRDLMIGFSPFTTVRLVGMGFVVLAVVALKVRPNLRSLLVGLMVSSPIFHLTLSMGDWITGTCGHWPKTLSGLTQAVTSSLPYFTHSLIGDLIFASLFLSLYTMAGYSFVAFRESLLSGKA